jgi:hypothetical protein
MSFGRRRGSACADCPGGNCYCDPKKNTSNDCSCEYKVSTLDFFIMTFIGMNIIFGINIMFETMSKFDCQIVVMAHVFLIFAFLKSCNMQDTYYRIMEHSLFVIFLDLVIIFYVSMIANMFN